MYRAGKTIKNGRRVRFGHIQRKNILNFGGQESLRTFLSPIFTRRRRDGKQAMQRLLSMIFFL